MYIVQNSVVATVCVSWMDSSASEVGKESS